MSGARYWEDWQVGDTLECGSVPVTAEAIKRFAAQYDPQPFHLDEAAAQKSLFKGLAASGWHTAAMTMRLIVQQPMASLGSPGFDDLRWLKPVRPGDTLHARLTCLDKRPSAAHSERGMAHFLVETLNSAGDIVMRLTLAAILARRPAA
ncbi:MAG: MaoC family dehydratase [Nevskiaceae bacterium]|nr:MAG: MaoC family dehydratase [Nevskiaceae bacterium]TBR72736.1 MAG: MaoC family dehydratase [Nevskiaceae bacterium]